MFTFKKKILMMPETEQGAGEGTTQSTEDSVTTEGEGISAEDLGYEPITEEAPATQTSNEPKTEEGDSKSESNSGYGTEPKEEESTKTGYEQEPEGEKVEDKKEEPPKKDDKSENKDDIVIEDKGELLDSEVEELKSFAKKHKLSKEAIADLVAQKKTQVEADKKTISELETKRKAQILEQRKNWYKELKEDKEFGGDNFAFNVKQSEKIMADLFPNTKKKLTETGGMLPPYVMKDLAKIAADFYKGGKFVQGDPIGAGDKPDSKWEHLGFYE